MLHVPMVWSNRVEFGAFIRCATQKVLPVKDLPYKFFMNDADPEEITDMLLNLDNFLKEKLVSEGSFGAVYQAVEKGTNKKYAIKILKNYQWTAKEQQSLLREVAIFTKMKHPCILTFRGYTLQDPDTKSPAIVTEFMTNGSLFDVMHRQRHGHQQQFWTPTCQMINILGIAVGMRHLHSHGVIHRDLKPGNVLLDENYEPKITDFGLSKFVKKGETQNQSMWGGTLQWMAPELLLKQPFQYSVDVYAFAMVLYELISGSQPYGSDINEYILPTEVISGIRPHFENTTIPLNYQTLCQNCWAQIPDERPTFDDIVHLLLRDDMILPDVDVNAYRAYARRIGCFSDVTPHHLAQPDYPCHEQYEYGMRLLTGDRTPPNPESAMVYFNKAASQGHPLAALELGKLIADPVLAAQQLTVAANAGVAEGQMRLGLAYLNGTGVAQDLPRAVSLFESAAAHGEPRASYCYGLMKYFGQGGTTASPDVGTLYILEAAEENIEEATAALARMGLIEELKDLAARKVPNAEYEFANYLRQIGQYDAAIHFFRRATEHGITKAYVDYAKMLELGMGVARNPIAALLEYQKGADLGHTGAMVEYARLAINAPPYEDKARAFLKKAIALQDQSAISFAQIIGFAM